MAEEQGQAPAAQPAIPESLNPHEAVGILAQALEAEDKPQAPRNDKGQFAKQEAAQPETEAKDAQPPAEEEPQPEAESEAQPEEPEAPRKLKLKYKGEEKEFLEPEVIELAQKGYDYTQKSQAIAKERDEIPAKIKAEVEARTNNYLQQLEIHKKAITQLSGVKSLPEIEQLARTDPSAAQQEFLRMVAVNQSLAQLEAETAKVHAERETAARETFTKQARQSVEKLQERIPGWNNDLYGKILKGAVDQYGFESTDVNAITDHRAIEVLNDALKWREYQAAKPKTVEKRVAQVPKVQKPGTAEKPSPNADRLKDSVAKLNKTGNRQDAQEAVRLLIESGRL